MRLQGAAYLSAFCLVVIQVGIGIIMKSSQAGGSYTFSVSSAVTISELLKCILSASFILRDCLIQRSGPAQTHLILPSSPRPSDDEAVIEMKTKYSEQGPEDPVVFHDDDEDMDCPPPRTTLFNQFVSQLSYVSVKSRYGFAMLAWLYALINNTVRYLVPLEDLPRGE